MPPSGGAPVPLTSPRLLTLRLTLSGLPPTILRPVSRSLQKNRERFPIYLKRKFARKQLSELCASYRKMPMSAASRDLYRDRGERLVALGNMLKVFDRN